MYSRSICYHASVPNTKHRAWDPSRLFLVGPRKSTDALEMCFVISLGPLQCFARDSAAAMLECIERHHEH